MIDKCKKCIHYPVCDNKNYNIVKPCDFYKKEQEDLCETCKHGDVCELSTKIFYPSVKTSKCYKYEEAEAEADMSEGKE